jgi:hypothetical protein
MFGDACFQVPRPLPVNLTVQVRPCTTGEELGRDGRCRVCPSGTYGRNGQCLPCKQGAQCPGGALLLPEVGWWHSSHVSDVFIPCLQPEACRCAYINIGRRGSSWWQMYCNRADPTLLTTVVAQHATQLLCLYGPCTTLLCMHSQWQCNIAGRTMAAGCRICRAITMCVYADMRDFPDVPLPAQRAGAPASSCRCTSSSTMTGWSAPW